MESPDDFAVVIGISDYDHLPKLTGPDTDARLFEQWLLDSQDGAGIPPANVKAATGRVVLHEIQAAFEGIYRLGQEKLDDSSQGHRCYIFASGHGYSSKGSGLALLAADADRQMLGRAVDLMAFSDGLVESGLFDEVVLFADVGRSSDQHGWSPAQPAWAVSRSTRRTRGYLYGLAARPGEHALGEEVAPEGGVAHGLFTRALLEGLLGAATTNRGVIDSESLVAYVSTRLKELGGTFTGRELAPEFRRIGSPIVFRTGVKLADAAPQASTASAIDENPIVAGVSQKAGLAKPVDRSLNLLLTAAVSLLDQKKSETGVLSSSTLFLAAVEWGGNPEAPVDAPPGVRMLADAVMTDVAAYEQLVNGMFRRVPLRLSFDPSDFKIPSFELSDNLRRAIRDAERTEGSLDASSVLTSILHVAEEPEGEPSWLADRLRGLGVEPKGLEAKLQGGLEPVHAEQEQQDTELEMSQRVSEALGYATRIAESVAQSVDSRHAFIGLMLAEERRTDSTTLSTKIHAALARSQSPPTPSVAQRLLERFGGHGPPVAPGEIGPLSDDGQRLVGEARAVAQRTSDTNRVAARHLFGAMFASTAFAVWDWLRSGDIDPDALRSITLKAQQDFPVTGDDVDVWAALLSRRPGSGPISGYTSDRVAFGERLKDQLGLESEVEALSAVIMAKDVTPPISIGLFGDWGTGKSYFMSMMHGQVQAIGERAKLALRQNERTSFCSHVVQIDFNAWHFVDSNLWASIVTRILSELARQLGGDPKKHPDRYAQALTQLIENTARAKIALQQAQDADVLAQAKVTELKSGLDKLDEDIASAKAAAPSVRDLARAAMDDPNIAASLNDAGGTLGIDVPKTADELRSTVAQAQSLPGRLRGLVNWVAGSPSTARSARGRRFAALILVVLMSLGVPLFAAWLVARSLSGPRQDLFALLAFAGTALANAATWMRTGFHAVGAAITQLEQARDRLAHTMTEEQLKEQKRIQTQLDEMRTRRHETSRQLDEATAALSAADAAQKRLDINTFLFEWIVERSSRTAYRDQLGIISYIREDFEELGRLLSRDARARGSALNPVDRIVLYIDDLDRCPSDRVVEVLQAVHLLLAFPLFVVVVGVDPRWLLHSLEHQYSAFGSSGDDDGDAADDAAGHWLTTPHNYLEKIFQIPFTMRPMDSIGFANLVSDLTAPQTTRTEADGRLPSAAPGSEQAPVQEVEPAVSGSGTRSATATDGHESSYSELVDDGHIDRPSTSSPLPSDVAQSGTGADIRADTEADTGADAEADPTEADATGADSAVGSGRGCTSTRSLAISISRHSSETSSLSSTNLWPRRAQRSDS